MSNRFYNALFKETKEDLETVLKKEQPEEPIPLISDRDVAIKNVSELYLSYINIVKNLNECYEKMLHPQKRKIVRIFLEGAICRTLELKEEMVQLEFRDFHFLDDMFSKFDMNPRDWNIPIPSYFQEEKTDEQKENEEWIANAFVGAQDVDETQLSMEEAFSIIKKCERSRQRRSFYMNALELKRLEEEERSKFSKKKEKPLMSEEEAAVVIQKRWRGFLARKQYAIDKLEEMCFLGMMPAMSPKSEVSASDIKMEVKKHRKEMQEKKERDYQSVVSNLRENIEIELVPNMAEKIEDDMREYFHAFKAENEAFPDLPPDEEGGSSVFFAPKEISEAETAETSKDKGGKEKKGKEEKGKKDDKKKKEEDEGFKMKPSKNIPVLSETMEKFNEVYDTETPSKKRKDKNVFQFVKKNFDPLETWCLHSDDFNTKIIEDELMKATEIRVRQQVDAIMRNELEALKTALDKDKGKKGKKKKGGKKGKKGKGGKKGKKGKKEKDLTPDRTFESLIEELVEQGILKEYPKVQLDDIIGSYCYHGSVIQKQFNTDPDPCIEDIKRVIKECCILPMASANIHENGPLTKSLLFAGSEGCGKTLFVHAICTEIGATLFDLTAENISGKYPGKPGLNMLMHLMSKVGKRLQPTVIYIRDAEKTFMKKVPKTDTTDPKRLKKDLPKFVKGITAADRIMVVGTTRLPFDVDLKGLGMYQKVIYIAKPDYGCRRELWSKMILKHGGVITPQLNISTLVNVSDGYTPFHIESIVKKVLNVRRIENIEKFPLVLTEFTSLLPLYVPIYDEEHKAFKAWMLKMPLGKKRNLLLKAGEDGGDGKKDKNKKKK